MNFFILLAIFKEMFIFTIHFVDGNYMFKVNNRNTRIRFEMCSKLTIKRPERHCVILVPLLLTLSIFQSLLYFNPYSIFKLTALREDFQCGALPIWSLLLCIRTEYKHLLYRSLYSNRERENKNQKKLCVWILFTQC